MDIALVIFLILLISAYIIKGVATKFRVMSEGYLWLLLAVHFLLAITYAAYAANTTSDSIAYYNVAKNTENWTDLWDVGTKFIQFIAWPFARFFDLSYYSCMLIFAFFGYLSILLFYITAKENITLPPVWQKYTAIELVFLLPNLHFWSSSLGKGAVILFGLGLFTFGLSRFNRRWIPILIGGILVFMVRPHILFTAVLSIMLGILITSSGIKNYMRWLIFIGLAIVFYYVSDQVFKFTEVETLDITTSTSLGHRAAELSKSTSGVDIQNYNLFMKMFTFWFRPLFFDGINVLGLIVSFENALYLYMFFIVIRNAIFNFGRWNGWFRICLFIFLFGSFALAQVTGNLGIAMRQKAQLMPFFFIVFCNALYYKTIVVTKFTRAHA